MKAKKRIVKDQLEQVILNAVKSFYINKKESFENINDNIIFSLIIHDPSKFGALDPYISEKLYYRILAHIFSQSHKRSHILKSVEISDKFEKLIIRLFSPNINGEFNYYFKTNTTVHDLNTNFTYLEYRPLDDKVIFRNRKFPKEIVVEMLIDDLILNPNTSYRILNLLKGYIYIMNNSMHTNNYSVHKNLEDIKNHPNSSFAKYILGGLNDKE